MRCRPRRGRWRSTREKETDRQSEEASNSPHSEEGVDDMDMFIAVESHVDVEFDSVGEMNEWC